MSDVVIGDCILHLGDCRQVLRRLEAESVNCCVTSPPYFGLRDYGHSDQIGLEPAPEDFVAAMVEVFREVRRVLKDDGTLWMNLGDSYSAGGNGGTGLQSTNKGSHLPPKNTPGYGAKQLLGIPWRVALALQADGWILRQDIIWHKPNPMPESIRDRCSKAHEYIFLLTKSAKYYFDAEAIREPVQSDRAPSRKAKAGGAGRGDLRASGTPYDGTGEDRNKRSVWTVSPKPFTGAHFATYPVELIEPCVLAGCPAGGVVLDPFGGAGTTALAAFKHGRKAELIELNPAYRDLAAERIARETAQRDMFVHTGAA